MNILIVDDWRRHLRGMAAMIREMWLDARVATAKDGGSRGRHRAVRAARRGAERHPDAEHGRACVLAAAGGGGLADKGRYMVSAYNLFEYAQ